MVSFKPAQVRFLAALGAAALTGFALFVYDLWVHHELVDDYLVINLILAGIPLLISTRLAAVLKHKLWSAWEPLVLSLLWLLFLPNSFYMISDYIHLQNATGGNVLFDAVMFSAFIYLAVGMGFISVYQVHSELKRRLQPITSAVLIGLVLLGSGFAVYLGRDLRWNSWDIFIHPGGLLFDVSSLLIKPQSYPGMIKISVSFFLVLASLYAFSWNAVRIVWQHGARDLAQRIKSTRTP